MWHWPLCINWLDRRRDWVGKDVRVIKDRYGNVRASEESVLRMGKEYLQELINEKKWQHKEDVWRTLTE